MCNNNKYADFHEKKKLNRLREIAMDLQNKWLNENVSLGFSTRTHTYVSFTLSLSLDEMRQNLNSNIRSTPLRIARIESECNQLENTRTQNEGKKIQQHQQQPELVLVHERNQLMYYWWKIYELKPKSHLTKHAQFGSLDARAQVLCSWFIWECDKFIASVRESQASKQTGKLRSECVCWPAKRLSNWLQTKWSALVFICGR